MRFEMKLLSLSLLAGAAMSIDLQPIQGVDNVPGVTLGTIYTNSTIKLKWTVAEGTVAILLWATYSDRSGQIGAFLRLLGSDM